MDELAAVTDDVEVYIARIKDRLGDSSEAVRADAVDDIGIQTTAPELAVPLLVSALKDASDSVSAHAANSLASFGTNALGTFLTLSNLVQTGGSNTASAALKTLVTLTPDQSFSILTNCIVHGRPGINEALKTLQAVAPENALPITQGVFIALAKQASDLVERATLAGWLHRTTQNIACQTVRTIERRRAREQEAVAMNELFSSSSEAFWEQIEPHLDAALGELSDVDREAVLLRYFQKKSAAEIASILGVSDEAAQKRLSRAVARRAWPCTDCESAFEKSIVRKFRRLSPRERIWTPNCVISPPLWRGNEAEIPGNEPKPVLK
jgi:RNA polymerase sigma factor (sigma-70 family)